MTIGEWTKQRFNLLGFPYTESIEAELMHNINPNDGFCPDLQEEVEVGMLSLLPYLISAPTSVSESGFSLTRQKMEDLYKVLLAKWGSKYGIEDTYGILNSITDATDVW